MQVAVAGSVDPQALQQLTVLRRKEVQQQRLADYQEAVVTLKSKVRDAEGQAMRETVQDKVCTPCPIAALCCGITSMRSLALLRIRAAHTPLFLYLQCKLLPGAFAMFQPPQVLL